jgi:hypothetical protein
MFNGGDDQFEETIDWGQSPTGYFDPFGDCPQSAHFDPNKPVPNRVTVPQSDKMKSAPFLMGRPPPAQTGHRLFIAPFVWPENLLPSQRS